ncbi:MAG: hypothetical protein V7719_02830 [Psychroserpens sp.]|uniref:hypothetical protein n=1 Tax=Psychroserpens sp. TaxID=2020870 RepID=UPI0030020824
MKHIYKIAVMFCLLMSITSCDETIDPVFVDDSRTFLSFTNATVNLPITIDDTGSVDLILNSSTVSSTDRVFNISLDAESNADPMTYVLPSTVLIPANSYQGTLTVSGVDNGLVDAAVKQIIFSLSDLPDTVDIDANRTVINVFEVCPVPEAYLVGDYMLVDNGNGNLLDGVVNVRIGGSATERVFETTFLPGTGVDTVLDVRISLACNVFSIGDVDISVSCTAGAAPFYIISNAGSANSTYSLASDTVHTVNYTEDPFTSCGPTATQNFTLTKL